VARMVPSVMGTSYCLPVRLSVIVSVSAIVLVVVLVPVLGQVYRWTGDAVGFRRPPRLIQHLAAPAAERAPLGVNRTLTAQHAQRRSNHSTYYSIPPICAECCGPRRRAADCGRRGA